MNLFQKLRSTSNFSINPPTELLLMKRSSVFIYSSIERMPKKVVLKALTNGTKHDIINVPKLSLVTFNTTEGWQIWFMVIAESVPSIKGLHDK